MPKNLLLEVDNISLGQQTLLKLDTLLPLGHVPLYQKIEKNERGQTEGLCQKQHVLIRV